MIDSQKFYDFERRNISGHESRLEITSRKTLTF